MRNNTTTTDYVNCLWYSLVMRHVLVTGINGFVGKHLAKILNEHGCQVSGVIYNGTVTEDLKQVLNQTLSCDLSDKNQVNRLDLTPYDVIINLAGLAQMGMSFEKPELFMHINVSVLQNICDRLLEQKHAPRILAISSGAVYESHQSMPLKETSKLIQDGSPYSQSKIAMEDVATTYREKGLPECLVARPFNHVGPGQKEGFIVPDLYKKLLHAIQSNTPLRVGNLSTRRDYTDVRDVANAYMLLALTEKKALSSPIYNVCSGVSHSGNEILSALEQQLPGSDQVTIKVDTSTARPNDPKELVGDNSLLRRDTAWVPKIPFEQTIKDFVQAQQS